MLFAAFIYLRGRDMLGRIFTISAKGDNICGFLFALLHASPILTRGLLSKERICSPWEKILSI